MNELLKESLGLESIDFQTDDFFSKIVEWVAVARDHYKDTWWPSSKKINDDLCNTLEKLVKTRLNMSIKFYIIPNRWAKATAYTHIEAINANQGLWTSRVPDYAIEQIAGDFKKRYEKILLKSPGWLDRKKAKVHGVFSDIVFTVVLSTGFLKNSELSSEEVAAAICHELGHCWDTLSTVSMAYEFTQGMTEIHRTLTQISMPEDRKYIINYLNTKESLSLDEATVNKISLASPDTAVGLLVTNRVLRRRSQTGVGSQETKASEQGADVFVARFGGAQHIATLVDKFGKMFFDIQRQSLTLHLIIQVLQIIYWQRRPIVFIIQVLMSWLMADNHFPYDDLINRTDKMRQQLLIRLKDKSLPKNVTDGILQEISVIEDLQKNYRNNLSLIEVITRTISSKHRNNLQTQDLIYHFERMANNKLFSSAAKIKTLS